MEEKIKVAQAPQTIDCVGKSCPKCGAPLQPGSLPSGGVTCTCPNCDRNIQRAQKKEGDLEKDIPIKITPVDLKVKDEGEPVEKGIDEVTPVGEEEPVEEEEKGAASETTDRITTLLSDVENMKEVLKSYLESSYKLSLSEDELRELTAKILSAIASFVADTTTGRIEELAGDLLEVEEKKK